MSSLNTALKLPEWYMTERNTEKTIDKLTSVKELDFYLNNPDEFIRRQAIIRLAHLKLKNSENKLREIIDDHIESNDNKNLAAWALKGVYSKLKNEILINNRYLARFTGTETINELYPATVEFQQPTITIDFSKNTEDLPLPSLKDEMYSTGISEFDSKININLWIKLFTEDLIKNLKNAVISFFKFLISVIAVIASLIFIKAPKGLWNWIKTRKVKSRDTVSVQTEPANTSLIYDRGKHREIYTSPQIDSLRKKTRAGKLPKNDFHPIQTVKKVLFYILYVLLFPLRILLRHKFFFLVLLSGLYIFFSFTTPGHILFNAYFGKDLNEIQSTAVTNMKNTTLKAWGKFMEVSSFDKAFTAKTKLQNKENEIKEMQKQQTFISTFTVTASKGLNIRKAPDASSEKIDGGSLKFGSAVTYTGKESKDSNGKLWYYIVASDGRTGWVYKKYLKSKEG